MVAINHWQFLISNLFLLLFNPSFHISFYADHKKDLSSKEIAAFKRYFMMYVLIFIMLIAMIIVGNILIYLNEN